MILDKNVITQEDNSNDTYDKALDKLKEEYEELQEAIKEKDNIHVAEEAFDVIQVILRVLELLSKDGLSIEQLSNRHNKKLVNRGWTHKKLLRILFK